MRCANSPQWEKPTVWAPASATISRGVRPLPAKSRTMARADMLVRGRFPSTSRASERRASRRPSATGNRGPPRMPTRSRAARARMSAQETTPGQAASSAALARSTASKASPGRERLISAARSGDASEESGETSTEASQPLTKQSWKKSRSVPAAVDGFARCLAAMTSDTIRSTRGQLWR
ncbi:hypothetical protein PAHAL_7G181900 [Panicum hallii]|uniref:Uncharacterized protein n=1 Tax=Panicum hallii TaxID=206008 RepID=A0A2T8ICM2_9POAL|nr:hypothetical protein PAHAL_7G181900 [Panicum hallii]